MKDYSKFSEKYNNRPNIKDANIVEEHENVEPVTEVETTPATEVPTEIETTPVTTEPETEVPTEVVTEPATEAETQEVGVVNTAKLNVRAEAKDDTDIVTIITKGTEVVIDRVLSTEEFYKVIVDDVEGYCVKKFIDIK